MPIYFYNAREKPYGCFSNFSRHGLELDGKWWPTSEHYFQAQKFAGTPHVGEVLRAPSPSEAAAIGRDRSRPLRPDWEQVKDDIMRRAVLAKFEQNAGTREILLSTGDEELVENAPNDDYWGCGADGTGRNMLGVILMETRAILRGQKRATRDRWKTFPLPEHRAALPYERAFSYAEYARLSMGFIPEAMEDKWFIFLEDEWLYFHRSWTGFCIYQVRLGAQGGQYQVTETWASRDLEQYRGTDAQADLNTLNNLIDRLLLGAA